MQMEKSESDILKKSGTWITAENTQMSGYYPSKKVFLSCYTFSSAQYKVLPRRMSFSLASQVPHYNSPCQHR